ncbi:MAG: ClbS/DfsB family four-helix bundle protein [Pseudomonadota bacterium]
MPAATTKADLLAVTESEYRKLAKLIAELPADLAEEKDEEDTSIKDVVAHRAHWIVLFLGWWRDGQAGKEVQFPAPGYNWSELKRYNADLRKTQAGLTWEAAMRDLSNGHAELVGFMEGLDDASLYGGPMKGARNTWTTGRWAEAAGPSHYRSAAKYIRARIRSAKRAGS